MNEEWLSITINQMTIFAAVVEQGGFLAASTCLHMTQSAVSKSIARLEKQLETPLFRRTTRSLEITEEGELIYGQWKQVLLQMEQAYALLKRKKSALKIGLTSTTRPERYFEEIRRKCRECMPDLTLDVESEYMTELEKKLLHGEYDLVFLPDFERYFIEEHQMQWKWAARSNAYVLMPSFHPLAGRSSVCMEELLGEEFAILRHTMTPGYERDLRERFEKYQATPKCTNIYHNANTLRHFFVPEKEVLLVDAFYDYIEHPQVVCVKVEDAYNGIICAWDPKRRREAVAHMLAAFS